MPTAVELEIGDSSATFTEFAGQYGGGITQEIVDVPILSGIESISGEVVRGSTQKLSESSMQHTTQTLAQQTTQTSTQQITQTLTQQATETSTKQAVRDSTELEIGESSITFTDSAGEYYGQQIRQETIDATSLPGGKSALSEIERESTQYFGESSTQQTTQTSKQATGEVIRVSVGEAVHGMRESVGAETTSKVIVQTATTAAQERISSSLESMKTAAESMEVCDSSSKESVQMSTPQTSTTVEMISQLAVIESEQHAYQQSLNIVSSVQHVSSAKTQDADQGTTVEAVSIGNKDVEATFRSSGASGFDVESGDISILHKNLVDS